MVKLRALLPQLEDSELEALWNKSDMYSMAFWPVSSSMLLSVICRAPMFGFAVSFSGSAACELLTTRSASRSKFMCATLFKANSQFSKEVSRNS